MALFDTAPASPSTIAVAVRRELAPGCALFDTGSEGPFLPSDFLATFDGVFGLALSSVTAARLFFPAEELERPLFSPKLGVEDLRFFSLSTRDAMPRRTAACDDTTRRSVRFKCVQSARAGGEGGEGF